MADAKANVQKQLTAIVDKIDGFIKKVPQLKPVLAKLPPNIKPAYVVLGLGALLLLFLLFGVGANALCNLVGFVYPMYASFKALKSHGKDDDTQWLTYWVVYGFFTTAESITDILVSWIPFYYLLKIVFLVYLMAPQTEGALKIWKKVIEPMLTKHEKKIDQALDKVQETAAQAGDVAGQIKKKLDEDDN